MDLPAGAVETRRRRSYSGPLRRVCSIGNLSGTTEQFQVCREKGALPKERTLGTAQSNDGRGASAVQRAESLHLSGELQ